MNKEQLISAVFERPPIWDQRHKQHHNRYILDKRWAEVASICKVTTPAAKKSWKVLRQQFKVHFDRLPPRRSGDPAPEDDVEWPYFKSLLFLRDIFEQRPVTGNLDDVDEDKETEEYENEEDDTQSLNGYISPPSTPSTSTQSSYQSSQQTSSRVSVPSRGKSDSLGYKKRPAPLDSVAQGLLQIEEEKLKMRKCKQTSDIDKNDEDVAFFTSLLPHIRKMSPVQKMRFRLKVQQLVMESVYEAPTPSSQHVTHSSQQLLYDEPQSYTVLSSPPFDYNNPL